MILNDLEPNFCTNQADHSIESFCHVGDWHKLDWLLYDLSLSLSTLILQLLDRELIEPDASEDGAWPASAAPTHDAD
jgi:hypothetical protein